MADINQFVDPLENIINKTREVYGIPDDTPTPILNQVPPPQEYEPEPESEPEETPTENNFDDEDIYGIRDQEQKIAQEEARLKAEEQARIQERLNERHANDKELQDLPPRSLDPEVQREAVDFQAQHVAIVTGMIEQVKAKYHLHGGIPAEKQRFIQGDLMEEYYQNGDTITPRFEQIILQNWQHVDPNTGEVYPSQQVAQNTNVQQPVKKEEDDTANITINVQPDSDVVVNLDGEAIKDFTKKKVINVNVRETTDIDMQAITVIENTSEPGVIHAYESALNDVPVTLPLSGYKCVIKPVNYFESIDLVAPRSDSKVDFQIQRWSIIYNHMKNISIGAFKNFEDFLKKTKYADMSILEWAILVATTDEEEPLEITCGNQKCRKVHTWKYMPRTIIHLNEERIPKKYRDVAEAYGPNALKLFTEINTKRIRYKLPKTGIIVEINEPSAYEYINKKLPLIIEKYREVRPDDPDMNNFDEERLTGDPTLVSFSYKMGCMMVISSISVPDEKNPNREYRFTEWDDIEEQIDNIKIIDDSLLLMKLVTQTRMNTNVADFYIENVTCPYCGRVDKRIPIQNITQNLLFQITRRLEDMEINLINLD